MYVASGPFPYRGRRPVDPTVVNADTAIAHEYNIHINPAIAAVTPTINALEDKTFASEAECHAECDRASSAVNRMFRNTLRQTQQAEANH